MSPAGSRWLSRGRFHGPLLAALGTAALLAGCGERKETLVVPKTPSTLSIALDGPPGAPLAPLYGAITGGDFTRAGLNLTIMSSPSPPLDRLASGGVDMAVASEPDLLRARDRGAALVAIAALVQGPLQAIISAPAQPVTKVTQLEGKTVATDGTPLAGAELDAILRRAGVPPTTVHRRPAPTPSDDLARPLLAKAAQASLGSLTTDAVRLRLAHRAPSLIKIDDAGIPTYNRLVLVVRQSEARNRGSVLRAFLQALTIGVRATLASPAAVIRQLVAVNPGLSGRFELASLRSALPFIDPAPTGSPYGFVDPRVWRTFGQWMLAQGLLTRPDDAARAVTDEFLPGQGE